MKRGSVTISELRAVDHTIQETLNGLSTMVDELSEANEGVDPAVYAERSMLIRRLSAKVVEAANIATGYTNLSDLEKF